MDVRGEKRIFPGFDCPDRSFGPGYGWDGFGLARGRNPSGPSKRLQHAHIECHFATWHSQRRQHLTLPWAAANGGLRGFWPPFPEIGLFPPFSALFALFQTAQTAPGKSRKRRKKAFFLRYPLICLEPPSLKPPFVALQLPPLQKHLVNTFYFSYLPGDVAIKNGGGFLVNFLWSPFPGKQSKKIRYENSTNKNGEYSFCNFSDLTELPT